MVGPVTVPTGLCPQWTILGWISNSAKCDSAQSLARKRPARRRKPLTESTYQNWEIERRRVLRDSLGVGIAVGSYGLSFGALAVTNGLSVPQAMALSY